MQALLGGHVYQSHELTHAGERIVCAHCGHPITGERKTKKLESGDRHYVYYRCTYYNIGDHPRVRVTEAEIDQQVLAIFDKMRIENEEVREWFRTVLRSQTKDSQADSLAQRGEIQRQITLAVSQQNRVVDMRINREIDEALFASKQTELRDRIAGLKLQLDVIDRSHDEMCDLAVKVFELSQPFARNGLWQITRQSAASSKSSL